jgi:hypothetical protein
MIPMDRGEGGIWHRNPAEMDRSPPSESKNGKRPATVFPPAECLCAWDCPGSIVMHQDYAFRVDGAFRHLECCRRLSLKRRMAEPEFEKSSEKILRTTSRLGERIDQYQSRDWTFRRRVVHHDSIGFHLGRRSISCGDMR